MTGTVIVDYGVGNLRSVQKAFEMAGATAEISGDGATLTGADAIVLPGVGAFGDAMENLRKRELIEPLRDAALERKVPFLGICLGMQLLFSGSEEGGHQDGLGIIPGKVVRFELSAAKDYWGKQLKLPHIGWNNISIDGRSRLLRGVPQDTDFYFVHSYHASETNSGHVAATCRYGEEFVCAIEVENVMATQFHPEKSQGEGQRIVANFVDICRGVDVAAAPLSGTA